MAADLVHGVLAAASSTILLTTLLVAARLWIRSRMGNLGKDDVTIKISYVMLLTMAGLMIAGVIDGGLGRLRDTVNDQDYEATLRYSAGISSTFSWGVATAKITFAILYIRVLPQRFLQLLNKFLIAFLIAQATEESLIAILHCRPIEAAFKLGVHGKCLNMNVLWWSTFVFNMCTDLILFVQPIPTVWRLQMARTKRVGLVVMMSLGLLVCVISIIRIVYASRIQEDLTYRIAEAMIWSVVELAALITCSCIPCLRQVIQQIPFLNHALGLSSNKTPHGIYEHSGQPRHGSTPFRTHKLDYLPSRSKAYAHGTSGHFGTMSHAAAGATGSPNDSQEEIFPHKKDGNGRIVVTKEVTHNVEYDRTQTESSPSESLRDEETPYPVRASKD
ncbi:uncharacterized protein F5Z01DRAFT_692182 [Emericellopsis atlantica]|uniref:Rhodopsin domain-containing protein n=1 Tax=Emericellopsis atlantica TaxID=2614577 RepID=A0A9P8CLI3_9HYPO|nr:uncharacterized protein F5Z01DRAFT_692182 [Emericellopsis atlantica]KAG9251428.1 hypothetical protein F5Z01DRAFT_692182 [Emericellopsis atlantica]